MGHMIFKTQDYLERPIICHIGLYNLKLEVIEKRILKETDKVNYLMNQNSQQPRQVIDEHLKQVEYLQQHLEDCRHYFYNRTVNTKYYSPETFDRLQQLDNRLEKSNNLLMSMKATSPFVKTFLKFI